MIFKCKVCGGSLDVKTGEKISICEYCGVRQSIPSLIEPKIQEIYNRANSYLMQNEFDKAENLYNQILFGNKDNADAYWNVLMCRYGVTYVKDPATGKYIPTCNRTLYNPIFNDEYYKNAIKYADETQKELYTSDAQTIDKIQKGIISVSKHEKPFDIFISYKETDLNGKRTQDSIVAQELYEKLTAEGYKVFFSRITLENKIGTEYEPYIYAALASSKVMITVSSSRENLEAVWVKNEWSRYLSFAAKDSEKTLIPLYYNMNSSDLPSEFAHLNTYNMQEKGFEQELIRGIKKLIPLPIMLLEKRRKRNKILKRIGILALIVLIIGVVLAIPWLKRLPEYNAAMQLYYDKNYPEATWAFDELGSYRDADEMKLKAEKSWRKSLASVALDVDLGGSSSGSYYVTPNGTVEAFNYNTGDSHDNLEINEHGKIVSIAGNSLLYTIREDGYVDNVAENNQITDISDWHNIIQISPVLNATNVALRSDGKMVYGNLQNQWNEDDTDNWMTDIARWENIVSFDYAYSKFGYGGLIEGAIVGVKSNGDVCVVVYDKEDSILSSEPIDVNDFVSKFSNVKKIDISINTVYNSNYSGSKKYLNAVALTKDNKVISYINGVYDEYDASEIVDVELGLSFDKDYNSNIYILELYSDGILKKKGSNKHILTDVIYLDNGFVITRSGNIYGGNYSKYNNGSDTLESTEGKTRVYDEWMERMN